MPMITYSEPPAERTESMVRILCGAAKPYTDRNGNVWSSDRYGDGGRAVTTKVPVEGAWPTEEDVAPLLKGIIG